MKPRYSLAGGSGRGSLTRLLSSCGPGSSEGLTGAGESASKLILVAVGRGGLSPLIGQALHKAFHDVASVFLQWGCSGVTAANTEAAVSFMTEPWT